MPMLKILHVCSSSSEDRVSQMAGLLLARESQMKEIFYLSLSPSQNQPAENLMDLESYKKWSCAEPGEKRAVVVLQVSLISHVSLLKLGVVCFI